MIIDKCANTKYRYETENFGVEDTVRYRDKSKKAIAEYIQKQLQEDLAYKQMCIREFAYLFAGKLIKASK